MICEIAGRSDERACNTKLLVVPGDSTLVDRLMDCSKLPDSVTGVNVTRKPGETLRPMSCDTRRLAWLELNPTTFHPRLPVNPTWIEGGDWLTTADEGGVMFTVPPVIGRPRIES